MTVKKNVNFSKWYTEINQKAELSDLRYNVKGFVVFRHWSTQIMNKMFEILEKELERTDHKPVLFPAVIPESNFKKEAEHVEGFLPEVFWITEAGGTGQKLEEKLALRPTSETAMYPTFSLWIRSHADLPLKTFQIVNTFRYETKQTRAFIRVREIHFFEAHTCHIDFKDAEKQINEDK